MAKDLDASAQTLGTFLCFFLIAFIFYFLGSLSSQVSHHVPPIAPCERPCCRQAELASEGDVTLMTERELEVRRILQETREMERRLRGDMAKLTDERKWEMKGWREEQIRWLWDSKKKEEKGMLAWFRARMK